MSEPETSDEPQKNGDRAASNSDSVASKLSQELNNWRRRRTNSRPARPESPGSNHSEPARTIKVRGHETLVVRKPKLASKPPTTNHSPSDQ